MLTGNICVVTTENVQAFLRGIQRNVLSELLMGEKRRYQYVRNPVLEEK